LTLLRYSTACCRNARLLSRRSGVGVFARSPELSRVAVTAVLLTTNACLQKTIPSGRYVTTQVTLEGTSALDRSELLAGLSTAESPRLFGVPGLEGVFFEYNLFDESLLEQDLQRLERACRAKGYYDAKVTVARVERDESKATVRVTLHIVEGSVVVVDRVNPTGLEQLPASIGFAAQRAITLKYDQPFEESSYEASKAGILSVLTDHGYAFAKVTGRAQVNRATHRAVVDFSVEPGPVSKYGRIDVIGLEEIPESVVRSTLQLETGRTYSKSELREAENALINLGVFSSVRIETTNVDKTAGVVPLVVRVHESTLRSVRVGVGSSIDPVQLSATVRLGWEDRNFLGGLRRFTIDERPGLIFFPTSTEKTVIPTRALPTNRLRAELRQPAFLEGRTTGRVSAEYNIYPLLFPLPPNAIAEHERILGYHEIRGSVGLERSFFDLRLLVSPSVTLQSNIPIAYQTPPGDDGILPGIDRISILYPELMTTLDLRDDRIEPHRGILLQNSVQFASLSFGKDRRDVRLKPEIRTYVPVSKKAVLATRVALGFLLPHHYGSTLDRPRDIATDPTDPEVLRDQHRLLFRAFYSGGPNSNRGYGYSEVGPHGPLGLLTSGDVNCYKNPNDPDCIRPLGGLSLWEASMEVRFPIVGALGGVTFIDASNVTRKRWSLDLTVPHLSPGVGLRYSTPIGPIRLDIGYRWIERTNLAPREGVIKDQAELHGWFGKDWLPLSLHLAIGEAF
jgi:outer membrane protein insertion porin family/translocation and assembly module TamA